MHGDRIQYITDDVFAAEIDGRFDLVFSVGLIEHFDDVTMKKLIGLHRQWAADDCLGTDSGADADDFLSDRPHRRGDSGHLEVSGRAPGTAGEAGGADARGGAGGDRRAHVVVPDPHASDYRRAAESGSGSAIQRVMPSGGRLVATPTVS